MLPIAKIRLRDLHHYDYPISLADQKQIFLPALMEKFELRL